MARAAATAAVPPFGRQQEATLPDVKNYTGGCHCGQVRFDVTADVTQVLDCNCSICRKRGALWAFVAADKFALRAGEETLTDYQFGKHTIHHLFCSQCGVGAFSRGTSPDGQDTVAVNVRCIDDMDMSTFQRTPFDGRSL
jgi:hypothetical protein